MSEKKSAKAPVDAKPAPEDLYKASYVGSGTFLIKKPKRNRTKLHRSASRMIAAAGSDKRVSSPQKSFLIKVKP